MLNISDYKLQYVNVSAADVAAAKPELFITEAAPLSGTPALTDAEVASLRNVGTQVIGYINSAVTDDARPYWNAAWTVNGTDTGTVTATAPAWLRSGAVNAFGIIADIRNTEWRQLVIDQAVNVVSRGYSGVFLDDVAQYFALGQVIGNTSGFADAMMTLVAEIKTAITVIDPEAILIVNATPYIVTDATKGATGSAAISFLASTDAMLLESYFGVTRAPETAAIVHAVDVIQPHMRLLAMEFGGTAHQNYLFQQQAASLGIVASTSLSSAYDQLHTMSAPGTTGDDTLRGTFGDDTIYAFAGDDRIRGGGGADTMHGGTGDDTYYVDTSRDRVIEKSGEGLDVVISKSSFFKLDGAIEILKFNGAGGFVGTGNSSSNQLHGAMGSDRFVDLKGGKDKFFGKAGSDTVDYRDAAAGFTLNLATKTHTGAATGDTFSSIENFFGSDGGADRMIGNKSAVSFFGFAGNDRLVGGKGKDNLSGGSGNDRLNGGRGNDVMTGGMGNDTFVFSKYKFGDDLITGFQDGIDRLDFSAFNIRMRDLTIVNNGKEDVAVYIHGYLSESISLSSDGPIKLTSADFIF